MHVRRREQIVSGAFIDGSRALPLIMSVLDFDVITHTPPLTHATLTMLVPPGKG